MPSPSEPFNLHLLLESVAHQYEPMARERGIDLSVLKTPSLPRLVLGDARALGLLLSLLLRDAVNRSLLGAITLRASDEQRSWDDHASIRLVVQDSWHCDLQSVGQGSPGDTQQHGPGSHPRGSKPCPLLSIHGENGPPLSRLATALGTHIEFDCHATTGILAWFTVSLELDLQAERLTRGSLPTGAHP